MRNKTAVVTALEGDYLRLRFTGEEAASEKRYLRTCTAAVGDRVLCIPVNGVYIVIGVILP